MFRRLRYFTARAGNAALNLLSQQLILAVGRVGEFMTEASK